MIRLSTSMAYWCFRNKVQGIYYNGNKGGTSPWTCEKAIMAWYDEPHYVLINKELVYFTIESTSLIPGYGIVKLFYNDEEKK